MKIKRIVLLLLTLTSCVVTTNTPAPIKSNVPVESNKPTESIKPSVKPIEKSDIKYVNIKTKALQYTNSPYHNIATVNDGNYLKDSRLDYTQPYYINLGLFIEGTKAEELFTANVVLNDESKYNNIIWESSDNDIFKIENGVLEGFKAGKADIIIKDKISNLELIRTPIIIIGKKYVPKPFVEGQGVSGGLLHVNTILTGKVTDDYGTPLSDVFFTISDIKGSPYYPFDTLIIAEQFYTPGNITISDINGNYKIIVPTTSINFSLIASKEGYKNMTRNIKSTFEGYYENFIMSKSGEVAQE